MSFFTKMAIAIAASALAPPTEAMKRSLAQEEALAQVEESIEITVLDSKTALNHLSQEMQASTIQEAAEASVFMDYQNALLDQIEALEQKLDLALSVQNGRIDEVENLVYHDRVDLDKFFTNQKDIEVPLLSSKHPYIENCKQVVEQHVTAGETFELNAHFSTQDDSQMATGFTAILYWRPEVGVPEWQWLTSSRTHGREPGTGNDDTTLLYRGRVDGNSFFKVCIGSFGDEQLIKPHHMQLGYKVYLDGYLGPDMVTTMPSFGSGPEPPATDRFILYDLPGCEGYAWDLGDINDIPSEWYVPNELIWGQWGDAAINDRVSSMELPAGMSAVFYKAGNMESVWGHESYIGKDGCQNISDSMNNQVTSLMVYNEN